MELRGQEVYLVNVKEDVGYKITGQVFSTYKQAKRQLFKELVRVNMRGVSVNIEEGKKEELKDSLNKRLMSELKEKEEENKTVYYKEDYIVLANGKQWANIVYGEIIKTEVL